MSHLQYRVGNLQGAGRRERQEDSFVVVNAVDEIKAREQGLFFAVCDGMGGMADGAKASKTAVDSLKNSFQMIDKTMDIAFQLRSMVCRASSDVESVIGGGGGSTVVAGILYNDRFYYSSVGDSYLWLMRDGCLYKLNREHNLCHQNYLRNIRNGIIDPADYQDQNEANALTGFLGMNGLDDIDCSVKPIPLWKNDVILACSDGVGGVIVEKDIMDILLQESEQEICKRIEQKLVDYGIPNQDNYTAIVVKCH